MRTVSILGATGSIGTQALEVIAAFPEHFRVAALAAHSQVELLAAQAREFRPEVVAIFREDRVPALRAALVGTGTRVVAGMDGLREVATLSGADTLLAAMVGAAGLLPLLDAARAGKRLAVANKEPLVAAGELVMQEAERGGATLVPVDSEPSAIFQCLAGEERGGVARLWLTASGGPLRGLDDAELERVTPEQALAHPTWRMGRKITVDSATLMNKGLELIEACRLFRIPEERISIIIHPQSVVHSMVEFVDGALLAQLGQPTMRTPIQYALGYPERLPRNWAPLDLAELGTLTFSAPDLARFPSPALARAALRAGGTTPTCLSAANEEAVEAFLAGAIGFLDIPRLVERAVEGHTPGDALRLSDILAADADARRIVKEWLA